MSIVGVLTSSDMEQFLKGGGEISIRPGNEEVERPIMLYSGFGASSRLKTALRTQNPKNKSSQPGEERVARTVVGKE